jgi:hypothetical protein
MTDERERRKVPRWFLIAALLAIGAALWYARYRSLSPSDVPVVAFSDFVSAVHSGQIDEITISRDRREYAFKKRGTAARGVAIGPEASDALVASLKPDDTSMPPPQVRYEH